jgi:hypothetical protein
MQTEHAIHAIENPEEFANAWEQEAEEEERVAKKKAALPKLVTATTAYVDRKPTTTPQLHRRRSCTRLPPPLHTPHTQSTWARCRLWSSTTAPECPRPVSQVGPTAAAEGKRGSADGC